MLHRLIGGPQWPGGGPQRSKVWSASPVKKGWRDWAYLPRRRLQGDFIIY